MAKSRIFVVDETASCLKHFASFLDFTVKANCVKKRNIFLFKTQMANFCFSNISKNRQTALALGWQLLQLEKLPPFSGSR